MPRESERPSWLVIPETGFYSGVPIVGAAGSGKTSACMYPFAQQLLSWQADRPDRRAGALILEVKGDFCHSVRRMLEEAGRADDYIEIGLDGSWQWNPLDDPLLDPYSLAYTVSSLINQLFGKSREPFWQQAYTNLVRWIVELHRLLPGGWVTLRDVYRCTIDAELFARKLGEAKELVARLCPTRRRHRQQRPGRAQEVSRGLGMGAGARRGDRHLSAGPGARGSPRRTRRRLRDRDRGGRSRERDKGAGRGDRALVQPRLDQARRQGPARRSSRASASSSRSSTSPGSPACSVPPPPDPDEAEHSSGSPTDRNGETVEPLPLIRRRLPPLAELIESGKVLALNMPAGANPALGRAIGVLLKNAWMQALLRRPAEAARRPGRYVRPAVFICDEYQAFATVGQDDPSGDEKAFALTRQCRCIPIVATQSISSLRSVLAGTEAWRTLVQTLPHPDLPLALRRLLGADRLRDVRRRPEDSALLHVHRDDGETRVLAPLGTRRRGQGHDRREQVVPAGRGEPRVLAEGSSRSSPTTKRSASPTTACRVSPARRVYLKPYYLPRKKSYWRLREEGRL